MLKKEGENRMLTEKEYKDLSIKEFTKAAEVYDSGHAGIYEMCRNDYPPVLDELKGKIHTANRLKICFRGRSF